MSSQWTPETTDALIEAMLLVRRQSGWRQAFVDFAMRHLVEPLAGPGGSRWDSLAVEEAGRAAERYLWGVVTAYKGRQYTPTTARTPRPQAASYGDDHMLKLAHEQKDLANICRILNRDEEWAKARLKDLFPLRGMPTLTGN